MVNAIINSNFPKSAIEALNREGFITIPLPSNEKIEFPVSTHPDMIIFVGFGSLVCHRDYYLNNQELIDSLVNIHSLCLLISDEEICSKYPDDAIFNACIVGNTLICNTKHISKLLLEVATTNGANIIHTNQGYTKCSTLIVGENDIITSDCGIHTAAQKAGINSLLIGAGNVSLEPYEYGFIGGATGLYGSKVYFCGNLDKHPDKEKICEFIESRGKECVFLPFDKLSDMGSIIFIN